MKNESSTLPICHLIFHAYKRLEFTRKSLEYLERNTKYPYKILLVNNDNTDETQKVLEAYPKDKVLKILRMKMNVGIILPTNYLWRKFPAKFFGKVDNDTLVPSGWLGTLIERLNECPRLGIIGAFHYSSMDAERILRENPERLINGKYFKAPFIGGCAYVLKKEVIDKMGLQPERSYIMDFTGYQQKATRYFDVGYCYPWVFAEIINLKNSPHHIPYPEYDEELWKKRHSKEASLPLEVLEYFKKNFR
jgi:cellulose synthase/poly-beta-1,6-N-acetylglucosamine synthase-like glycosyltransferase